MWTDITNLTVAFCNFANTPKRVSHRYDHLHSSDSQATVTALDSFQLHSDSVWDYHQSMVKLAKHSRMQLVWVPGHMGIDGNATADQLDTQGSSNPLTESQPALGTCAKVASRMIRG